MAYIIDRFENEFAVVETNDGIKNIPRSELPPDAAEGDVIVLTGGLYTVDKQATKSRRESVHSRFDKLKRK